MTPSPEPEKAVPVVAYLTTDEEGSPAMLFFDEQEAGNYCDFDELPAPLIRLTDHEAAMAALRTEVERARLAALNEAHEIVLRFARAQRKINDRGVALLAADEITAAITAAHGAQGGSNAE